jgi:hypothetical protein
MTINLGGTAFEGPVPLADVASWKLQGVFVVLGSRREDTGPAHTPLYVGRTDEAAAGFPWTHRRAACWEREAGAREHLCVAVHAMPYADDETREAVVRALIEQYQPRCNTRSHGD